MPVMKREAPETILVPEDMYVATVVSVEEAGPYTPKNGQPADDKPRKPQLKITYRLSAPDDPEFNNFELREYATITFNPTMAGKPSKWAQRCAVFCQVAGVPYPDEPGAEYDTDDFAGIKVRINVVHETRDDGSKKNAIASVTAIRSKSRPGAEPTPALKVADEDEPLPF